MSYRSMILRTGRRSVLRAGLAAPVAAAFRLGRPTRAASAATIEVTDLAGRTVRVRKGVLGEGRQPYAVAMLDRDDPFRRVAGRGDDLIKNDPDVHFVTGGNRGAVSPGNAAVPLGCDATPEAVQTRPRAPMERPGFPRMKAVRSKGSTAFCHQFYDAPFRFVAGLAMAKMLCPERFGDVHARFLPNAYPACSGRGCGSDGWGVWGAS